MNDIILDKKINIEDMIYEVRGKQVMLDSEIAVTKCHDSIYDNIVTHYDIGIPISVLINFADVSAKLERS